MNSILIFLAQAVAADALSSWDQAIGIVVLLGAAILSYFILRSIILPLLRSWVKRSKNQFDDILVDPRLIHRICLLAPFVMVYLLVSGTDYIPESLAGYLPAVFRSDDLSSTWWAPLEKINEAIIVLLITLIISAAFNAFNTVYQTFDISRQRPLKGYLQIL